MDSAAISLASIALCLEGYRSAKPAWWVAGGVVIIAAATCTPPLALLALVTMSWLALDHRLRQFLIPYAAGMFAGAIIFLAALLAGGLWMPFLAQMAWLRQNYSTVNAMPYGSLIGGYGRALAGASALGLAIRVPLLFCLALPAVLPIVALAGWLLVLMRCPRERAWAAVSAIPYLLGCTAVYTATTYPRADVMHLAFVAALPYVLAGLLIGRYLPQRAGAGLLLFFSVMAGMFLLHETNQLLTEVPVPSPVGTLRASAQDAKSLERLFQTVKSGDTLYVHPYMPLFYFLTQNVNPTRFSYLAPGLMTGQEELSALEELRVQPPAHVLYLPLSRQEFLRVFPHAGRLDHRFRSLEAWILHNYAPLRQPLSIADYQLYTSAPPFGPIPARGEHSPASPPFSIAVR
jgi:hypothetical protein